MTVQTVLDYLWELAPVEYKLSWDNVGLLLGRKNAPVTKILVSLDATPAVVAEAAERGCELLVTHHPVIFGSLSHVNDADPMTELPLRCLEAGLAVISMHTNLDCAPGGVNDVLARHLGLQGIQTLAGPDGVELLRAGDCEPMELSAFAALVKQRLACPGLRFVVGSGRVRRVAVGGGSCSDFMTTALQAGCDTLVTADVKYHAFQEAALRGLNLIDAGHFETESPVCPVLRDKLAARFPKAGVFLSAETDCIRFL